MSETIKTNLEFKLRLTGVGIEGKGLEQIEDSSYWFLIAQNGNLFGQNPFSPIYPIKKGLYIFDKVEPLIKIGNEYLSIEEIENRLGGNK